jgi:hypothetical protein
MQEIRIYKSLRIVEILYQEKTIKEEKENNIIGLKSQFVPNLANSITMNTIKE